MSFDEHFCWSLMSLAWVHKHFCLFLNINMFLCPISHISNGLILTLICLIFPIILESLIVLWHLFLCFYSLLLFVFVFIQLLQNGASETKLDVYFLLLYQLAWSKLGALLKPYYHGTSTLAILDEIITETENTYTIPNFMSLLVLFWSLVSMTLHGEGWRKITFDVVFLVLQKMSISNRTVEAQLIH